MSYLDSLRIVWYFRYGSTEKLLRLIGNENFNAIIKRGMICRGSLDPGVWRISESGRDLGDALFLRSRFRRWLDHLLYKFI